MKDWQNKKESEKIYERKFALISEDKLTKSCSEIGVLGTKMIYGELEKAKTEKEQKKINEVEKKLGGFICLSTSGSSGTPKLVKITKKNIQANTAGIIESLDLKDSDSSFVCLPLNYTYALSQINTSARILNSMDYGQISNTSWIY